MIRSRRRFWQFDSNLWTGILSLMQMSSSIILGFATFIFLVRILTKPDFGTWSLFISISTVFFFAKTGFIKFGQIRFYQTADRGQIPVVHTALLVTNTFFTLILVILQFGLSFIIDQLAHTSVLGGLLRINCIAMLVHIPLSFIEYYLEGVLKFKGILINNVVRGGLLFCFVLYCFLSDVSLLLPHLVWIQIGGIVLACICSVVLWGKEIRLSRYLDWKVVRECIHYGKYVFGTSLGSMLSRSFDQLLLGYFLGPVAVARYNPVLRISNIVSLPIYSVASIVFPKSASDIRSSDLTRTKYLYEKSVGYILAMILPMIIVVLIFSKTVISLVAGSRYLDSAPILQIFILVFILTPFSTQFGSIFDAIGRQKTTFQIVIFNMVLSLATHFFLIREFGVIGAAWAMLLTTTITVIIQQFVVRQVLKVHTFAAFQYIPDFYRLLFHSLFRGQADQ